MTATSETVVGSPEDLSALLSPMSISTEIPARDRAPSPSQDIWSPPSTQSSTGPWLSFADALTSTPAADASTSASHRPSGRAVMGGRRDPWDNLPVLPRKVLLWMYDRATGVAGARWMSAADIARAQGVPMPTDGASEAQYKFLLSVERAHIRYHAYLYHSDILTGLVREGHVQYDVQRDKYRVPAGPGMYNFDLRDI